MKYYSCFMSRVSGNIIDKSISTEDLDEIEKLDIILNFIIVYSYYYVQTYASVAAAGNSTK